jgi:class 3 adenylate cyclase/DNA-binding winged helix-turn-helix (wHTH) protein
MRYWWGTTVLDTGTQELFTDGREVAVEPQVFAVLEHLVEHRDRVVTKDELLDVIWGDRFVSESALTTRIKQARHAVGDSGSAQRAIKTVHGRGFRFVAPIEADSARNTATQLVGIVREDETPPTHWAYSNGASIAYQSFGEGPDLVFVAGFGTNLDVQWEHPSIAAFLRRLGSFARVTILDKRGVGLSDRLPTEDPPPLETRADDLRAVMDCAGIARASVLGSSEGGSLAALFTASHPERAERLILHNTWARTAWLADWKPDLDRIARSWGSGHLYQVLGPSLGLTAEGRKLLAKLERQSATPMTARRLIELIEQIDISDALGAISVPTLVLRRRDDRVIDISQGKLLAEGIPGARLVVLDGADHWIFSGDTSVMLDEIERFLTSTEPAPRGFDRFLATVLFVDMVESTAAARMGDAPWANTLDRFYADAHRVITMHQGEFVKTTGDGFMAVFDGPGRAVRAARRVQERSQSLPTRLRAGIHTAEVERLGGDVVGIGVNIASRVADRAEPGTVWVSRTVTDLVAGAGLRFEERGSHQLKGVDQPWSLFEAVD